MKFVLAMVGVAFSLGACVAGPVGNPSPPQPAKAVTLDRYLGKWYEVARYDMRFEKGCEGVTAEYSKRPDGLIRVLNTCRQGAVDGPIKTSEGKAKVVDAATNAKLKVSFFGPFYGDYWVLDHGDDYDWSIVGEGSGRYLWLLSRKLPTDADRAALTARAKALGYDVGMLRPTKQPAP
ncbi:MULTISPECIES: lipocalin family protein [Caulobacter]|jgi:apolipoprotein D and lipocalin family protein|uniref:Outer membrane lipoprotein Blc n=1 Tax=Caulobacter vibrioides OR37 TaxID=1292034 RepID=R0CRJ1_CAUVI|nr:MULTISPECIES: lipocalin family protein [Caulobacter]ENZ79040.1 bacterial lipocalin [Caulobacter vibrioides OR37]MBQ1563465.1 lipocalin family protein [Caulobacter sp.]